MIRVIVEAPPTGTGFMPYRVDWWAHGRPQFVGVSPWPLLDACRQLHRAGVMNDTVVGLFVEGEDTWRERTTVGYGAKHMGPYREFPGGPIKEAGQPLSGAPTATPEEPQRPESTPPDMLTDTGPAEPKPAKSGKSHHPRKPRASGGQRGLGRGR